MIFYGKIKEHKEIRNNVLELISTAAATPIKQKDEYFGDDITRSDWGNANDYERPWVQKMLNPFMTEMLSMCNLAGYKDFELFEIWFQQYEKNSKHGWHIHGRNYTGVYYLQFDGTAKTQVWNNEIMNLNCEEGDIVMFPSFMIHRAPPVQNDKTKTIISFNIEFKDIDGKKLAEIDSA
mgnify:FL=1|tara:strand:- start:13173 stop:13709 length:537 start_codon:yes stop_codon:yes gene_type:complete